MNFEIKTYFVIFCIIGVLLLIFPLKTIYINIKEQERFNQSQKIDIIFPENFEGQAIIITEKECGQEKIIKNNREQLIIPKNGLLFYKEKIKNDEEYYNFNYYTIQGEDTITVPDKFTQKGFINPVKSKFKVFYIDGTLNSNENLDKILLYFDNSRVKPDLSTELLNKDFKCNLTQK